MSHAYNSGITSKANGPLDGLSAIFMFPPVLLAAGVLILWLKAREDRIARGLPWQAGFGWPLWKNPDNRTHAQCVVDADLAEAELNFDYKGVD